VSRPGEAEACVARAGVPTPLARLRAFVACRRCAVGWAVYLVAAIAAVALFGAA
jgi:hypothetical protein